METRNKISSTQLEDVPIIDHQCYVKSSTLTSDELTTKYDEWDVRSYCNFYDRHRTILGFLGGILCVILATCFLVPLIYIILTSDYLSLDAQAEDNFDEHKAPERTVLVTGTEKDLKDSNVNELPYDDVLRAIHREIYAEESPGRTRSKREALPEINSCIQNMDHCRSVLDSMKDVVSVFYNTMPHLQDSKNLTNKMPESSATLKDLLECIKCKNLVAKDSVTFARSSDQVNDRHTSLDVTSNPTNNDAETYTKDNQKENVESLTLNSENFELQKNIKESMTSENFNNSIVKSVDSTTQINTRRREIYSDSSTSVRKDNKEIPTELLAINGSLDTSRIFTTESTMETSLSNVSRDNTERIDASSGNVTTTTATMTMMTTRPTVEDVTEIPNRNTMHLTTHPSSQGQTEDELVTAIKGTELKEDVKNGWEDSLMTARDSASGKRIMSNEYMHTKRIVEPSQTTMPTAEMMKSSQQLQLTPTMSWMPYPVCFYGPPTDSGSSKQSSPGQFIYPGLSSPGPLTMMSQQRGHNFPNLVNQASSPNYVQVQAQSVQFLPMQPSPSSSYPRNLPPFSFNGQSSVGAGPTGPGVQNFPFSGYQLPISGQTSSARSPYYCTYIPAPTFQYPAIPGTTEFQRSSPTLGKELDKLRSFERNFQFFCPNGYILCTSGERCVSKLQWCDGQVDCMDASDETRCSCRDRLTKERLCDGYFDCPHGEDELGCFGCPKTSFSCDDWERRYTSENCVPFSQRCDDIKQCANGKDEKDCNILTPTYVKGKSIFTVGYVEGFLQKNLRGEWYPVCTASSSWAMDACVSEIGTIMNGLPEIKIHNTVNDMYHGFYLSEENNETKLVSTCNNTGIYVKCPQIPCGTRAIARQDNFKTSLLYNEDPLLRSENNTTDYNEVNDKSYSKAKELLDRYLESNSKEQNDSLVGADLRVVGGRASKPMAWPFLVAIYKDGSFHCGGVILDESWILTAAHCLDGFSKHYYEVQAGMLRRFSFSPMAQSRKAKYTIMHPQYDRVDMRNDIGIIKLDEPLNFNRWIRQVCLPKADIVGSNWRQGPPVDTSCIAIGWGATREQGPDPDHLREVEVPILSTCKHTADQGEGSICAGYPQGGRDACQGDSGGPLMCRNPYRESQWYVAGIVSHGEGCARPNEPGVYTKVSHYMEWIQEITSNDAIPPIGKIPLERCLGFTCEGGLGKCLSIQRRCDRIVDCLDGEDEVNCFDQTYYALMMQSNANSEFITPIINGNPENDKISTKDTMTDINSDRNLASFRKKEKDETMLTNIEEQNVINSRVQDSGINSPTIPSNMITNEIFGTTIESERINSSGEDLDINSTITMTSNVTFTCTKLTQSIPIEKYCDRVFDCEDGTDEIFCTCKDFLRKAQPSAICDGYLDCKDKTDEENCTICDKSQFLCRRSNVCVSTSIVCDGKFDCPLKEDELDCFALTNGQDVFLDADERPRLNIQGILTHQTQGDWRPACHSEKIHQNQSTISLIGQNMCEYFGFASLQSAWQVVVKNSALRTLAWSKEYITGYENASVPLTQNDEHEVCPGLYIHCRPVLRSGVNTHLTIAPKNGSRTYLWPWLAAIFVDNTYRCTALLLDTKWLLSNSKCIQGVRLDVNYTVALLGYGPSYLYVDGPYQEVSTIDSVKFVKDSVAVLLHLKNPVNATRHIRPIFVEKVVYPLSAEDTCVAVGTDESAEMKSIFLQPVLEDCPSCHRCFVNTTISQCHTNDTSNWSGTIFCLGDKGWYPAAVFLENNSSCVFRNTQSLTSIDYINPYLMQAIEDDLETMSEPKCDGFRCSVGQCISYDRICDGVRDCRDAADEDVEYCQKVERDCENSIQGCKCTKSEMRCGNGNCIEKSAFCDAKVDCSDGTDEPAKCTCAAYLRLTAPERLCDGVWHCLDKSDESPELCPCKDTSFRCKTSIGNDTCIPQDFVCDGENDCPTGEDEAECRMLKQSVSDRLGTGEVIRRSYGVWHSECFPAPISSDTEASNICRSLGYVTGNMNKEIVTLDEPELPVHDDFYMVKLNDWTWITMRNDKPLITLAKTQETCHRAFINCI